MRGGLTPTLSLERELDKQSFNVHPFKKEFRSVGVTLRLGV